MLENVASQVSEVGCQTTTRSQQLAMFLAGFGWAGLGETDLTWPARFKMASDINKRKVGAILAMILLSEEVKPSRK